MIIQTNGNNLKNLLLILLLAGVASSAPSVNLPLEHWAYPFLQRLEAKGLFSNYELRVRPLPRDKAAEMVEQAFTKASTQPDLLSKSDWALLEQLRSDLSDEFQNRSSVIKTVLPEPHLYKLREERGALLFDLVGRQSIISNRGQQYSPDQLLSETTLGGQIRGQLGNTLAFFAQARNTLTRGEERDPDDENFDPDQGAPVVTSGKNVYRDRATAYFVWENPWLRMEAGRDEFDWGPSLGNGLALSQNAPPADLLRLSVRMNRCKFTYLHAWLRSSLGQKYLVAHRADITLFRGAYLGLTETVIYGGRALEPTYLNPLMLYHIAEHHLGDRDNNNISIDAAFTRIPNVALFAEWYIDDMTSTRSWKNYFGNKFGWSLGGLWADAFSLNNMDLTLRYTKISPFVYTHWDSINIYTHYDKIIGNDLGPNADAVFLQIGRQFGRDFRTEIYYQHTRKGRGTASTETQPLVGNRKDFLKGVFEQRSLVGFRVVDQVRRDLFITLSYSYQDIRNLGLIPGRFSFDHLVRFQLDVNY